MNGDCTTSSTQRHLSQRSQLCGRTRRSAFTFSNCHRSSEGRHGYRGRATARPPTRREQPCPPFPTTEQERTESAKPWRVCIPRQGAAATVAAAGLLGGSITVRVADGLSLPIGGRATPFLLLVSSVRRDFGPTLSDCLPHPTPVYCCCALGLWATWCNPRTSRPR